MAFPPKKTSVIHVRADPADVEKWRSLAIDGNLSAWLRGLAEDEVRRRSPSRRYPARAYKDARGIVRYLEEIV